MLFLGTGLGKTIITLTTIVDRMRAGQVQKTLIFGPLRVIQAVWEREARKWSHTAHLRFSTLHGPRDKRQRALFSQADIFLVNYEQMNWLAGELDRYYLRQDRPLPFQSVVYDECSKLKSSTTVRMAGGDRDRKNRRGERYQVTMVGWQKILNHFRYRTGLTGTPASNGYLDLHGQYLAVDGGKRLGTHITGYKTAYFRSDYNGWNYTPTPLGKKWIEQAISDITCKMDSRDYLDLPDVQVTDMMVTMPPSTRRIYEEMERELFVELDSGHEIELFNRASLSNKCLQISNGSAYLEPGSPEFETLHDVKLDALDEVLEEAAGSPVLCSYTFKSDAERIMKRFKKYRPVNLTASRSADTEAIIDRWNSGKIKLMVAHPASCSHGIDGLQDSGHTLVWFGLNWSLELYEQMNGRIDRQGQKHPVSLIRILCDKTIDLAVADALEGKSSTQSELKAALQRYRGKSDVIPPPAISFLEPEVSFF
jgi:SNF2 family DNA or RNA helicase